jgi:hypothetical protein
MLVPKGNSPWAKDVRFHELLHVKYSPPEGAPPDCGASVESILAAEDYRVNTLGQHIRPHDAVAHQPGKTDAFMMATRYSERQMARMAVAVMGYQSSERKVTEMSRGLADVVWNGSLPDWLREHANRLNNIVRTVWHTAPRYVAEAERGVNNFRDAIRLATWLDQFPDAEPKPAPMPSDDEENEDYDDAVDGSTGDASMARWGEMRIETPPLPVTHPTARPQRTTPSLSGSRIKNWNRLPTGEIFGRTRRTGTPDAVLIDQSGSMHWDADKLHQLVKQIPVGIVAGYAGEDGEGTLRILARDGRMVAPELVAPERGGNEVDGPALRWLASQRGRKVWVSDQGVCSNVCHDEAALMADCQATIKAAGIKTCLTTEPTEIMRALRG